MESQKVKDCRKFMKALAEMNESVPKFEDLNLEAICDLLQPMQYAQGLYSLRNFEYFDHLSNQQLLHTSILELFD